MPPLADQLIRRVLGGLVTLFGVTVVVFVLMHSIPGNAALVLAGGPDMQAVSEEELRELERRFGLDRPLVVQYTEWAGRVLQGDLGTSLRTGNPVATDLVRRIPYTAQIAVFATLIAVCFGVPLGVLSANIRGSRTDDALRIFSLVGLAAPSFWVGLLIILGLVTFFRWSPPLFWQPVWENPGQSLSQFVWPSLSVGFYLMAINTRMTRSTVLEVLRQDYIRTATAKGLDRARILRKHALPNAAMEIVTLLGLEFATLFGGLIVTETVFNVPGMSQYVVLSIQFRDYPAMQGVVLLMAAIVVAVNLLVDLSYAWLNPVTRRS